jgi:Pro-Pro endopeptidase
MVIRRFFSVFLVILLFFTINETKAEAAKVFWDGAELKPGQIGKMTITKPINLWRTINGRLTFSRIVYPNEVYRVYGYDSATLQYSVGAGYSITNINDYLKYETPSKAKLAQANQTDNTDSKKLLVEKITVNQSSLLNDDKRIQDVKYTLYGLPAYVLESFVQENVKIKLTSGRITALAEFSHLKGKVPRGWEETGKTWDDVPGIGGGKVVGMNIDMIPSGSGHGSINLVLHETFHTLDKVILNRISSSREFQDIWREEAKRLFPITGYYQNYSEEYFAECLAYYYHNESTRKSLKEKAPKSYSFVLILDRKERMNNQLE